MAGTGTKRIAARFYRTAAGNQPARDWLLDLPIEAKSRRG